MSLFVAVSCYTCAATLLVPAVHVALTVHTCLHMLVRSRVMLVLRVDVSSTDRTCTVSYLD
jgi:hypothetical protein